MSLHPSREGSRDTFEGLVISKYPDVCRSPTAPVPYTIVAYQCDDANTCATVRLTGMRAHNQGSIITRCTGDEPGTGLGVKSNTVSSVCHRLGHSSTVNFEGKPATRDGDLWWMNNKNTIGKLNWFTGSETFEDTPPIRYASLATNSVSDASPMSDASPEGQNGSGATLQMAQFGGAAQAQAQPAPSNPVAQPNPSNPITPNNPQPGRRPSTQAPAANDNAKPTATNKYWVNPLSMLGNLMAQFQLYQELKRRWDTMPDRLREAARKDGVIPNQGDIQQDLAKQFSDSDFGRDYPGGWQAFTKLNPKQMEEAIDKWKKEKEKQNETKVDAPPVGVTESNVKTKEDQRRRNRCKRKIGRYKQKCGVDAVGRPLQDHHMYADFGFRSGARPDNPEAFARNPGKRLSAAGKSVPGAPGFYGAPSICIDQGMHTLLHAKINDRLRNETTPVDSLDKIMDINREELIKAAPECTKEILMATAPVDAAVRGRGYSGRARERIGAEPQKQLEKSWGY